MITKSQFCHDASVSDVGDLVKVMLCACFGKYYAIYCVQVVMKLMVFMGCWW